MMKIKLVVTLLFLIEFMSIKSQNDFDKYGPFGSVIYTDLKTALDVKEKVYKLDLSYKKLEPKLVAKIFKLNDLQALKLSGNEIKTYPQNFSELSNLLYFASYNNEFTGFLPNLKAFVNLNYIEFFGAKIDSIPAEIAYLNRLKTLKISSTNDTLFLPETLHYLKFLKELTIENCILDSLPYEVFNVENLQFLNLTNTQIQALPSNLKKMQKLEVLILDANKLNDLPYQIYCIKKLRFLSVKNNFLKKIPASVSQLINLTVLDVTGNNFSKEYIEELKALLPGCEIRF